MRKPGSSDKLNKPSGPAIGADIAMMGETGKGIANNNTVTLSIKASAANDLVSAGQVIG